jgi:hypothetical protein
MQVGPENATFYRPHGMQQMVMIVPVDTHVHEAQHIASMAAITPSLKAVSRSLFIGDLLLGRLGGLNSSQRVCGGLADGTPSLENERRALGSISRLSLLPEWI